MTMDWLQTTLRGHVTALAEDIGPRTPFDGDGLDRAARYLTNRFSEYGLEVCEQPYDFQGKRVVNLIATPPAAAHRSRYYVIGAHYDTVPSSPGADDNASAVAVMLELARRFSGKPATPPLRFAAFTLEEEPAFVTPQQGSRIFVRERQRAGDSIAAALILEMVGFTSPRQDYPFILRWAGYPSHGEYIGIIGNWRSRRIGRAVLEGFRRNPALPVEALTVPFDGRVLPATRLSDHASFWDAGIPALMITDTAFFRNPHYHLPSDTPDTLDFRFMAELVQSLEYAIEALPALT